MEIPEENSRIPNEQSSYSQQTTTITTAATTRNTTITVPSDTTVLTTTQSTADTTTIQTSTTAAVLDRNGTYTTKDDVALYLYTYGELPKNFITKKEAQKLGWPGGSLEPYAPGKCIGGSYFGNYEELLPKKNGRSYYECDIDTLGANSRGAKRIVYSNDGLIYYTADHYESFELLYGDVE
ncbi:MAG: ribonuclease [Oscillospiraceae bacterium]|nr:ribonuclease [Oscillospiraceae bacterium]